MSQRPAVSQRPSDAEMLAGYADLPAGQLLTVVARQHDIDAAVLRRRAIELGLPLARRELETLRDLREQWARAVGDPPTPR